VEVVDGEHHYLYTDRLKALDSSLDRLEAEELSLNDLDNLRYVYNRLKKNYYLNKKVQDKKHQELKRLKLVVENRLYRLIEQKRYELLYASKTQKSMRRAGFIDRVKQFQERITRRIAAAGIFFPYTQ
jgi:hypothetical protein